MSVFNFASTVACFGPEPITLKRVSSGPAFVNGFATKPASADVVIQAVIWPTGGQELQVLPEGLRTREARTLVTTSALQAAINPDVAYPDRFAYDGSTWEVQIVTNWSQKGSYYLSIATKLEEQGV